jgi:uncharacterized protein (TIGR02145 family)
MPWLMLLLGDEESATLTCDSSHLNLCTTSLDCTYGGGYWWSDNTCLGVPESETVTSAGRVWMDRNLGATQVATSPADAAAYGDLYQWGRMADGHQLRTSATTSTTSSTDVPGHGDFICDGVDWRGPPNNNLWQGVSGINNPCPAGFRLPTAEELDTEMASWSSQDAVGAFNTKLKFTLSGWRKGDTGAVMGEGSMANYWSSSATDTGIFLVAVVLQFDASSSVVTYFGDLFDYTNNFWNSAGASVRCIQD